MEMFTGNLDQDIPEEVIEHRVLEVLGRFESIEYKSLLDEVLCKTGDYSTVAENRLQLVLGSMRDRGIIQGQNFGWFSLVNQAKQAPTLTAQPAVAPAVPKAKGILASLRKAVNG